MTTTSRLLIPALAISALALPACGASFSFVFEEEGSGVAETTSFDVGEFTGVEIEDAFEASIEIVEGPTTVEVTVDDNFTDDLKVEVDDSDVLKVDLDLNSWRAEVRPTVVISVPSLDLVHASGAAHVVVDGVLEESDIDIDASGASRIDLSVDTDSLDVDASGASRILVDGTAVSVGIDASGASQVELDGVTADSAQVDASGASTIAIGEVSVVDGDLSGASNLSVPDDANVRVDTSGASNVNRD